MSDYESKSHSLYGSVTFMPTPLLSLSLQGNYTQSDAALEPVNMPTPDEAIEHLDYTFGDMHNYSDLEYKLAEIGLGLNYKVSTGIEWYSEGWYYDLTDELGYVYGDETGSLFVIRSGVKIGLDQVMNK
ncbi:MAG: hypothetical protein GF404_02970 [candidate division Zixibacteria bacterium]|jgi:hypothetical protein|nr:hypothetical protein [candidate division Zixibacteria bacterium]